MSDKKTDGLGLQEPTHKGYILKQAREAKGISLETVHEATKIPLDALRAIEEDYKVKILSEFYYNSFLKIYAKYLGVEVSRVIEVDRKVIKPRPIEKDYEINFNLLESINRKLTKERKRQIFYVLAGLLCCWLVFKFVSFMMHRKPAASKVTATRTIEMGEEASFPPLIIDSSDISSQDDVDTTPTLGDEIVGPPMDPAATSSTKSVVLTVRARKESWLRVKADGNVVFQSTLNAGDVETWDADETIEITGRNIGELEFEHNGKMIGTLGRSGRRAKGLIVTPEGLSVTK